MATITNIIINYIKENISNADEGIYNEHLDYRYVYDYNVSTFTFIENKYTKKENLRIIIDDTTLKNLIDIIKNINKKISFIKFLNDNKTIAILHYKNNNFTVKFYKKRIPIYIGIVQQNVGEYYITCKMTENDIYVWANEIARSEPYFNFNLSKELIYDKISPSALSVDKIILVDLFTHDLKSISFHNITNIFKEIYDIPTDNTYIDKYFKYIFFKIREFFLGAIIFSYNDMYRVSFIYHTDVQILINILKRYVLIFIDYKNRRLKLDNSELLQCLKLIKYYNVNIINNILLKIFNSEKDYERFIKFIKTNNMYIVGTILFAFYSNMPTGTADTICLYIKKKDNDDILNFINSFPLEIEIESCHIISINYYHIRISYTTMHSKTIMINVLIISQKSIFEISEEFDFCRICYDGERIIQLQVNNRNMIEENGDLKKSVIKNFVKFINNNIIIINTSEEKIIKLLI